MNISFTDGRTQEFDLPLGEIIVGRSVDCGLILEDKSISRQHAKITVRKVGVEIEDLQSSNGVIVNGKQAADRILLQDGDDVLLGTVKLKLRLCGDDERTLLFEAIEGLESVEKPADQTPTSAILPESSGPASTGQEKAEFELEEDTKVDALQTGASSRKAAVAPGSAEEKAVPGRPDSNIAKLIIYPEGLPKETFQLSKDVINIGRSEENDIVINHNSVSRFHAKVMAHGQDYFLLDLDSANGTKVNGRSVSKHKLQHWDEIVFGSVLARFAGKSGNETTSSKVSSKRPSARQRSTQWRIIVLALLLVLLIAALLSQMIR